MEFTDLSMMIDSEAYGELQVLSVLSLPWLIISDMSLDSHSLLVTRWNKLNDCNFHRA